MARNACMGVSCSGWFSRDPIEIRELVAFLGLEPRQNSLWPMVGHSWKTIIFWEIEDEHGKSDCAKVGGLVMVCLVGSGSGFRKLVS